MEASQGVSALSGAARHGRWRRVLRLLAAGSGPAGAAPAGAALLRAGGAGRCLGAAAAIHPHALRPLLVAALRLAPARPASLAAAGAARAPRPARAGRLHPRLAAAQRRPAGLLHPALRAQVRVVRAALRGAARYRISAVRNGAAIRALIFPFLIRQGKPTPFFTFLLALLFCIYNGYLQGRSLSTYAEYPSDWLKYPCFIAGFMGWLIGMAINIHSDHILRNLRKPGETGYKIPRGGMFEYVSGANFFGEILEWFGFALACCTTESLAFALCTLFILGSRAKQHHQWYLEKFEDYPKNRKIVIPFVY
ncbi:3-oxo-5-alpha-steroid 4-dehydrogenase 1 isoform X4 [Gallus gallus]|uniref:3-oxo-5-alpha-steroid 4-dehydrogenase 1 isoform X4 n=1 Tax=Gallus gallus TaxID=9031 RepID=UPI001F01AF57|nr:3-oxo-5-alpha-steroid 4-dehydrogenase 1 isoform X4 [Gallus gallus]